MLWLKVVSLYWFSAGEGIQGIIKGCHGFGNVLNSTRSEH